MGGTFLYQGRFNMMGKELYSVTLRYNQISEFWTQVVILYDPLRSHLLLFTIQQILFIIIAIIFSLL